LCPTSSTEEPVSTHSRISKSGDIWSRIWTCNKDIAKQLAALERLVLRRMSGGNKVNENWRK